MEEYHKIQTVFKRDPETKFKTLLDGEFSFPALEFLQNNLWTFTEKVDGTNIRIVFDGKLSFKGKTDNAQIQASLVDRLRSLFDPLEQRMREVFPYGACLYGEGYGAKIQKGGGNYSDTQEFVLFDVKIGDLWLEQHNVADIAEKLGLQVVPVIGTGTLRDMVYLACGGIRSKWGDFQAEGIVARPTTELRARDGRRIITKIKTKDFGP